MSSYPKLHSRSVSTQHLGGVIYSTLSRIKSWLALVLVLVTVILIAVIHLLEYDIVCTGVYGGAHENLLGICPDEEKAFVTYSALRFNG